MKTKCASRSRRVADKPRTTPLPALRESRRMAGPGQGPTRGATVYFRRHNAEFLRADCPVFRRRGYLPGRSLDFEPLAGAATARSGEALALRERGRDDWADTYSVQNALLPVRVDFRHLRRGGDLPVPLGGGFQPARAVRADRDGDLHWLPVGGLCVRLAETRAGVGVSVQVRAATLRERHSGRRDISDAWLRLWIDL